MGVVKQRAEESSLEQIEAFPAGSGRMELGAESQAGQYSLFEAVLSKHPYRRRTARPPAKLRGEFTMPPSRHSLDNALAESKNGAVARKRMGRQFLPRRPQRPAAPPAAAGSTPAQTSIEPAPSPR